MGLKCRDYGQRKYSTCQSRRSMIFCSMSNHRQGPLNCENLWVINWFWRRCGSRRDGGCRRNARNAGNGFPELPRRPNAVDLENRRGNDREDGSWLGTRAFPLSKPKRNETGQTRGTHRPCYALHHRRGSRGSVSARLVVLGRWVSITGMGSCVWHRNDRGLMVLRLPIHGLGSVWPAIS